MDLVDVLKGILDVGDLVKREPDVDAGLQGHF